MSTQKKCVLQLMQYKEINMLSWWVGPLWILEEILSRTECGSICAPRLRAAVWMTSFFGILVVLWRRYKGDPVVSVLLRDLVGTGSDVLGVAIKLMIMYYLEQFRPFSADETALALTLAAVYVCLVDVRTVYRL